MKKRILSWLICCLMLMMTACSNTSDQSADNNGADVGNTVTGGAASNSDKTFNVGIAGEWRSLDPAFNYNAYEFLALDSMYDTLLVFSHDGTKLEPCLAKSWKQVDDVTYVYQIRDDVHFWNGDLMTADDVVFCLDRIRNPKVSANTAFMFSKVKSIKKTNKWEVTIKLNTPDSTFKYALASTAGQIVEKKFVEAAGNSFGNAEKGTMGTGPYVYQKWTQGSQMVMTKNKNYWNKNVKFTFDKVVINVFSDNTSLAVAATAGQIDFAINPSNDVIPKYEASKNMEIKYEKGVNDSFIAFNCQRAPFSDVNVRKAVAVAIDSNAIVKGLQDMRYTSFAGSIDFDPNAMNFDKDNWVALEKQLDPYKYDVEKAKKYLAASSYPNGFDCTMVVNSEQKSLAEAIQAYLKVLNINLKIKELTSAEYISYIYGAKVDKDGKRDYDLTYYGWLPDYLDPANYLIPFYWTGNIASGGSNIAAYSNKEVDADIEKMLVTSDDSKRSEYMLDAYKIINPACPYKYFTWSGLTYVINKKYKTSLSPIWIYNFNYTQVTKK